MADEQPYVPLTTPTWKGNMTMRRIATGFAIIVAMMSFGGVAYAQESTTPPTTIETTTPSAEQPTTTPVPTTETPDAGVESSTNPATIEPRGTTRAVTIAPPVETPVVTSTTSVTAAQRSTAVVAPVAVTGSTTSTTYDEFVATPHNVMPMGVVNRSLDAPTGFVGVLAKPWVGWGLGMSILVFFIGLGMVLFNWRGTGSTHD